MQRPNTRVHIPAGGPTPIQLDGSVAGAPEDGGLCPIALDDGPGRGLCVGFLPPDTEPPIEWVYTQFVPAANRFAHYGYIRHVYTAANRTFHYRYSGYEVPTDPRNATTDEDVTCV